MEIKRQEILRRRRLLNEEFRALSVVPLMRGTIVERVRKCGRSNCVCATDLKARHKGKYLTVNLGGRLEAVVLRFEDEGPVREAISRYNRLWEIVNGLTGCEIAELRRRALERRRKRRERRT